MRDNIFPFLKTWLMRDNVFPFLKSWLWDAPDTFASHKLIPGYSESTAIPWIALGRSVKGAPEFLTWKEFTGKSSGHNLSRQAIALVSAVPARWEKKTIVVGDIVRVPALQCFSERFTTEKVLDEKFLALAHKEIGSDRLAVAMPKRGVLFVADLNSDLEFLNKFQYATRLIYANDMYATNRLQEHVSPLLFLSIEAKLCGVVDFIEDNEKLGPPLGFRILAPGPTSTENARLAFADGTSVVVNKFEFGNEQYERLSMFRPGEIHSALDYPKHSRSSILLQASNNLLSGGFILFCETEQTRIADGPLVPLSARICALDVRSMNIDTSFSVLNNFYDCGYIGIDVDPSGRYAIIGINCTSITGPSLILYDSSYKSFTDIDNYEIVECPLDQVRWGSQSDELVFHDYDSNSTVKVALDLFTFRVGSPVER